MSPTGFLDKDALRHLTGKAQVSTQDEWLRNRNIPYKREGSRLLVMWTHVEAWIEGRPTSALVEPDFSYLEKSQAEYAAKKAVWAENRARKEAEKAAKARAQEGARDDATSTGRGPR